MLHVKKLIKTTLLLLPILAMAFYMTTAAYQYTGAETELIALINSEREASGAPPLAINWELTRLARYKSEEMKKHRLFGHESLVYGNPAQLLDRFHVPYGTVGTNIAMGQETPQEVVAAWRNSPGHHANLLNQSFTSAGVGLSFDEYGIPYWTLILIAE